MRDSRAGLLVAAALLQAGCYNYLPLRRSQLVPATYLALTLSDAGSEQLAPYLGPNVRVVRGQFLSVGERGLSLSVRSVELHRGELLAWQGETVMVPQEFVWSVEERQVAGSKTALLAGASLVAFFVAYQAFGAGASGGRGSGSGPKTSPR